jgi:3'-phosphoadenosine 5'-phosphosulfate sulfotransferase (PAPS reductase)/FAD synthetase
MIPEELQKKIDRSIKLLQSVGKRYDGVIEIAYSGGKDSDVILQLANEAGIKYEAIYKNTTIDPPGTIAHAKAMGATIIRPQLSFFQLVAKKGLPSRFRRFCCADLKEYKVYDKAVIGVRKAESRGRNDRYNEPTQCRWFGAKTKTNHVEQIMPILDWTDDDVLTFIQDRNIPLAPVYYDRGGK